ncbi:MAG: glycosyltransferase [Nostocaceae cyanobacterium]|nr:glycosyltransferase [Nostocaceae cyanobacterium]
MIYLLTVNYYSTSLVTQLINSLPFSKNIDYKIIIINNSPDDTSIYNLQSESIIILTSPSNLGFGSGCNLGIKWIYSQDSQAILWIINPDAYLPENTLEQVEPFFINNPHLSIVGTIIHTPTGEIWFAGGRFVPEKGAILELDLLTNSQTHFVECDWVSGCSLIINLRNFNDYPLFDQDYFLYYEDFDFCRRYSQQGHLIAVTNKFAVIHQPSTITNRNVFHKIKHSTYSYLLTQEKYATKLVLNLRLTRLVTYAILLLVVKPQIAFGKLYGVLIYWRRSLPF